MSWAIFSEFGGIVCHKLKFLTVQALEVWGHVLPTVAVELDECIDDALADKGIRAVKNEEE